MCHSQCMADRTEETKSKWDSFIAIPASGVVFASGGAMIGSATGGPFGALLVGGLGALVGAGVEIASQWRRKNPDGTGE